MRDSIRKQAISVVVPVYNELKNLSNLVIRLNTALQKTKKPYQLIFIDDHSTDGTYEYLKKLQTVQKIQVYKKVGKKGKSFSLIEGFEKAAGSILVMIDADLQYPPEAIVKMVEQLEKTDVVVANRKRTNAVTLRSFLSNGFRYIFGEFLFKLPYDVQSGLKVFKKEVFQTVSFQPVSGWTFDLEFLHRTRHAGFTIQNFDISFEERKNGSSKVGFFKTSWEIGTNALAVKVKRLHPLVIGAQNLTSMHGSGIRYKGGTYITHTILPHEKSALQTFTTGQKIVILAYVLDVIVGFILFPILTLQILVGLLSLIYFTDVLFNLFVVLKSLYTSQEVSVSVSIIKALSDNQLPMYSILCPLYKEAHVIPQFLKYISKLDWPQNKLDVMLLLEQDDVLTIQAVKTLKLPSYVRVVVVPDSQPKTKPKACNYGLSIAKGEYLVIYDAEDMPEPLQLKKAYVTFQKVAKNVICLQAKLNYYNPNQNLLTRLFTAEYSLWFDITLPGLQSVRSSIPLGGTSNHFKTESLKNLLGWDPFNVTEDADLGIRLFKHGYKTAIIDSTTLEEANSNVKNWLRQRSRWIKGYMQTYLVHMRKHEQGKKMTAFHNAIFQMNVGGKIAFILINPILWVITIMYFTLLSYVGSFIELLYLTPVFYMAVFSLAFGNFMFIYLYMVGCAKRNQWNLMKYIYFVPFYWLLISIAGQIALYQLLFKPHYWEKTIHGLHVKKSQKPAELVIEISDSKGDVKKPAAAAQRVDQNTQVSFVSSLKAGTRQVITIFRNNWTALLGLLTYRSKTTSNKRGILILNWRDTKHVWAGGAEVYIDELAKRWVKDGNNVTVFCGNDGKQLQIQTINGVQIIRCGGFYTVYVWAFLYYVAHFRKEVDVIIDSENGVPFFTPLYSKKPIILLIHHIHQDIFTKHLIFPLAMVAKFAESVVMPRLYKEKTIITVSNSSRKEIIEIGFANADKIKIVYPGINNQNFTRMKKSSTPLYGYVGRLKPYKNIDVALKAFAKVVAQIPQAKFVIAGEGESTDKLKRLSRKLNISENVQFLGKVTEKQKAGLLAKSWFVVQPSTLEGWGITVIEANACGTPVIASNVNGLRDSVMDGQTGMLVEMGNVDAFAQAMMYLSRKKAFREKLSKQAYKWSKLFSWDKSARTSYEIVEELIEEQKIRPLFGKYALAQTK